MKHLKNNIFVIISFINFSLLLGNSFILPVELTKSSLEKSFEKEEVKEKKTKDMFLKTPQQWSGYMKNSFMKKPLALAYDSPQINNIFKPPIFL